MPTSCLVLTRPLCILWRADGQLQLGLDTDGSILLPDAPPGIDAVVRALRTPRTPLEIARLVPLVPRETLERFLDGLLASGLLTQGAATRAESVTVLGSGPLAGAISDLLTREGAAVGSGLRTLPEARGVVVLCAGTAEPDRVLARDLTAAGLPHLVVRAEPERAVVGPFVVPGRTTCLGCTDLVRRDLDAHWPHLLAQLCRSEHVPAPRQSAWAAAMASAQLASWRAGVAPDTVGATHELDAHTGEVGTRRWPRHPDCGCMLAGR